MKKKLNALSCPFPMGGLKVRMYGGPYRERPAGTFGVCMAAELCDLPAQVKVPTQDFSIPNPDVLIDGVEQVIMALAEGRTVYAGCMGGIGRTGLVMAVTAKALGVKEPVKWVRKHYKPHAVETQQQQRFIADIDTSPLKSVVRRAKIRRWMRFWQCE